MLVSLGAILMSPIEDAGRLSIIEVQVRPPFVVFHKPPVAKPGDAIRGVVPGIDDATFREKANAAKVGCPVSQALSAVPITLEATLRAE